MKKDTEKTKVIFYSVKDDSMVFAYFPEMEHNSQYKTCYAHIGQHSACHPDYVRDLRKARVDEYNDLALELEQIGYNLEILN